VPNLNARRDAEEGQDARHERLARFAGDRFAIRALSQGLAQAFFAFEQNLRDYFICMQ
jgi:hypothetical protein